MKRFLITIYLFSLVIALVILSEAKNPLNLLRSEPASAATVNTSGNVSLPSLNNGLVGWWTMDGKDIAGTSLADKSGNGNTGTLDSGITKAVGKIGQATKFDGANKIALSGISAPAQNTPFAECAWIKINEPNAVNVSAGVIINSSNNSSIVLYTVYGSDWTGSSKLFKLYVSVRGGYGAGTSLSWYNRNNWNHVCLNYGSDNNFTLYVNGNYDNSFSAGATSWIAGNTVSSIGSSFNGGTYFKGLIDDVRIYNRALSQKEIQALYQQGGGKINKSEAVKPSLTSGLVGWWTMDAADYLSATTIKDKSGNNNTGTLTGPITKASGKIGQAVNSQGISAFISATSSPSSLSGVGVTGDMTLSAWVKPVNFSLYYTGILSKDKSNIAAPYEWRLTPTTGYPELLLGNGAAATNIGAGGTHAVLNKWNFLSVTRQNGTTTFYFNGQKDGVSSVAATLGDAGTPVYIGTRNDNGTILRGSIDDVRVYNRALSATEIQMLYQQGNNKVNKSETTRPNLNSGLVGYWTFDGKNMTATKALDRSGNGYDASKIGTPGVAIGKIGQSALLKADSAGDALGYFRIGSGGVAGPIPDLTQITLSTWVKFKSFGSVGTMVASRDNASYQTKWIISFPGNYTSLIPSFSPGSAGLSFIKVMPTNQWVHLAASTGPLGTSLYWNGALVNASSTMTSLASAAGPLYLGERGDGYGMDGQLDDFRLYNRALSAAEIKLLYQMGK